MNGTEEHALDLIERVRELTDELLEHLHAGRLDQLDPTLDLREAALVRMRATLGSVGPDLPEPIQARMRALRAQDEDVRETLRIEKQEVLRGLGAVRGLEIDPYVDGIDGPVAVDRRG